jgi:membrane carboxypeptidase/penicillin-binding protein
MNKLSELKDGELLLVCTSSNYDGKVMSKADLLNDLEYYKEKYKNDEKFEIYTTTEYHAQLNAQDVLDNALENEYQDMYEDWYEIIWNDVETRDIRDIQVVLDRILARNSERNTVYNLDKKVEFDI